MKTHVILFFCFLFGIFIHCNSKNRLSADNYYPISFDYNQNSLLEEINLSRSRDHYFDDVSPWSFSTLFLADIEVSDFNEFRTLLDDYNIDLMNSMNKIVGCEFNVSYKKFQAGILFGFDYRSNDKHDSLKINFNKTLYSINFGYKLIDTYRFQIIPMVGARLYHYRLINSNKIKSIPIGQYITERDLDIRFNQPIGYAGLKISFKLYDEFILKGDYWSAGFYGNYIFKLSDKPFVYSLKNRLLTTQSINYFNFNLGVFLAMHIN
jgi:hypothetical protein